MFYKSFKKVLIGFMILTMFVSLIGCSAKRATDTMGLSGSAPNGQSAPNSSATYDAIAPTVSFGESSATVGSAVTTSSANFTAKTKQEADRHKIIQTGELYIETLKYDDSVKAVSAYIKTIGGYVQTENVQGKGVDFESQSTLRKALFVFRVPKDQFDAVFEQAGNFGDVRNQVKQGEDISEQYMDTEARLETLKIRQDRLQSLLKQATKLADIITLEKEIQQVSYEIESLTGSLRKWDSLVDYSTITMSVQEVLEVKKTEPTVKETLGTRMLYSLSTSITNTWYWIQSLLVLLAGLLPLIIVLCLIGIPVAFIFRKQRSRHQQTDQVMPVEVPQKSEDEETTL